MPAAARSSQDIEQRVARVLRTGGLAEIDVLILEVDGAANAAKESALRARERARLSTVEAISARAEQDDAAFLWDNLTALLRQLQQRRAELINTVNIVN
jgi:hypothetical protein